MTQAKINWYNKPYHFSEEYQSTGMLFAFLSSPKDGNRVCHGWIKCRDFLHDAVRTQVTGVTSNIYDFYFERNKNPPIDLKKMRMLVSSKNLVNKASIVEFRRHMQYALNLLNHFEAYGGIALSKMVEVKDVEGSGYPCVFLFTGSGVWMKSPILVSLYSFLLRLGVKKFAFKNAVDLRKKFKEEVDRPDPDKDAGYLRSNWNKLHTIVKARNALFDYQDGFHSLYFKATDIHSFHNYAGVLSLAKGMTPDKELNEKMKELSSKGGK